ncbi:cerebellin-3-like [Saccostrea echinata]|uniref:cerebellin-3-like n=1 Tax=Saccostrea echinata TaxID=191078 RepID=UPI002A8011FB|nr:cerebellin-3-like [Saccostrea echinata]
MGYEGLLLFSILSLGILGLSSGENIHKGVVSREEFEDLKRLVMGLNEKIEIQEQKLLDQENEINSLKGNVEERDEFIKKMTTLSKENLESKKERCRIVPVPTEAVVAFYAYMSANENSPGVHHTLIYDHEVTNIGNGYSRHSGTFTAPVAGVYVFTWNTFTVTNSGNQYMSIEITLNSQPVGVTFVQGGGDYAGVTGTVVLSIQKNDVIYTRTHKTYVPVGSIRSDNLMRSTFSGWCLSCH